MKAWDPSSYRARLVSGGHRTSLFLLALLVLGACAGSLPWQERARTEIDTPASFNVLSEAFNDGDELPARYTCDGADIEPTLGWEDNSGAMAYVITMTDTSADGFVHWILFGVPGSVQNFPDGSPPSGATDGLNDFGTRGYRGPCPPPGDGPHRYVFSVYALNRSLVPYGGEMTLENVLGVIECCVTARGTMEVTYDR